MIKIVLLATFLVAAAIPLSAALASGPLDGLRTPAEESGYERTTSSQEVIDFLTEATRNSGGRMRLEFITRTVGGRLVPLLVIGSPLPKDPGDVAADKAVVIVNCNIHSGEVEGKEAMLIFAREAAQGKHDDLLKNLVILLNPNMNPDGNDRLGYWRRNSQFTPAMMGTRDNGQGFNINRDMTKLDSFEGRAMVEVMNRWDPVIFIDAHATNGSYMRHAVTYNWGLHPNTDPDVMKYNRGEFSRKAIGRDSYLFKTLGRRAIPYGNFEDYTQKPSSGKWVTFEDYPRYTTNYAGLRNRLALLLEVYSYDDFKTRVETQYACVYGALQTVAGDKEKIKALIATADARSLARAADGIPASDAIALDSSLVILEEGDDNYVAAGGKVDVDSYAENDPDNGIVPDFTADGDGYRTGMSIAEPRTYSLDYYGKFVPKGTVPMGALYVIKPGAYKAVDLLLAHGIEVRKLTKEVSAAEFQWFKIDSMNTMRTLYEGHYRNAVSGGWETSRDLAIPRDSFVVSTAQKNGALAALLIEPMCVDGMVAWNMLDNQIFNETINQGRVPDRFRTRDSVTNAWVSMPVWKLSSYDAIPGGAMTALERPPHDDSLPKAIE
jgi:hypothetical protein